MIARSGLVDQSAVAALTARDRIAFVFFERDAVTLTELVTNLETSERSRQNIPGSIQNRRAKASAIRDDASEFPHF